MRLLKLLLISLLLVNSAYALQFKLPPAKEDVVGQIQFAQVKTGDTFASIARHFDVGYFELAAANPEVNPDQLEVGTELIIPTQYILPHVARTGIVINLSAMRLFYFPAGKNYFFTYPVGIGRQDWNSPQGVLRIIQKIKDPVWYVPDSIYQFRQKNGDPVPHVMPAGPQNPLGAYAMRLSKPTYLIHGTNDVSSVGRRSSAGCVHLYPEDIDALFHMTPIGTGVLFVNEPYLLGVQGNKLWLEAHLPLEEMRAALADPFADVMALVKALNMNPAPEVDWNQAKQIINEHSGMPTVIGQTQPLKKN